MTVRFEFRSCYAHASLDIAARHNNGRTWHEGHVVSDDQGVARFSLTWRPKAILGASTNPDDVAGNYGVVVTGADNTAFNITVTNDDQTPPISEWSA